MKIEELRKMYERYKDSTFGAPLTMIKPHKWQSKYMSVMTPFGKCRILNESQDAEGIHVVFQVTTAQLKKFLDKWEPEPKGDGEK